MLEELYLLKRKWREKCPWGTEKDQPEKKEKLKREMIWN